MDIENKELSFINNLKEELNNDYIGDDAALSNNLLICKDVLSENIHFLPSTPLDLVISKLFTSNMSDIAAMGGIPTKCLIGISLDKDRFNKNAIISSIKKECHRYNVEVIGGDTTAAQDSNFLSLTALGKPNKNVIYRTGACNDDLIYISRITGLCRKSLELELNNSKEEYEIDKEILESYGINSSEKNFLDKYFHYKVMAETYIGDILGNIEGVTSLTDISDSLHIDLKSILYSSKVSAILDLNNIEILNCDKTKILGNSLKEKIEYFMTSGEEYCLLFTVSKKDEDNILKIIKEKANRDIIKIGKIINSNDNNHKIYNYDMNEINSNSYNKKSYEHFE